MITGDDFRIIPEITDVKLVQRCSASCRYMIQNMWLKAIVLELNWVSQIFLSATMCLSIASIVP